MGKYRVVIFFDAANDKAAGAMAVKAAELVKATEARLTTQRTTWGAVQAEAEAVA